MRVNGQRRKISLGTNHEGWSRERARVELERTVGMIERGTWKVSVPEQAPADDQSLEALAAQWWERRKDELRPNTRADYEWRLEFILAGLGGQAVAALDIRRIDEFRDRLRKPRQGRTLSPRSVNMVLDVLAQILDDAVEYRLLEQNPARGRRRRLKVPRPRRAFLDPGMVVDLLAVAGEWEAQVPEHQRYGRRALLATLCLAGPRISELTGARRSALDIHGGRLRVGDSKTPAGERDIELTAFLLGELRSHLATSADASPDLTIFRTRSGKPISPSNIRTRLIAGTVARANERRAAAGKILIPDGITPHALRRTFASLALTAGRDPRWVMAQLGHTDARLTLNVYAQVMQRQRVDRALVWELMRFSDESGAAPTLNSFGPTIDPIEPILPSDAPDTIPNA